MCVENKDITRFAGGDDCRRARSPAADIVDCNHVELVFRVWAQAAHRVVHGDDAGYLGEGLVREFRFVLDDEVEQGLGACVGPGETNRCRHYFGRADICRCYW